MYLSIIFDNIQALPFRLWIIEAPFPGNGMPPAAKGLTLMAVNVTPVVTIFDPTPCPVCPLRTLSKKLRYA